MGHEILVWGLIQVQICYIIYSYKGNKYAGYSQ